MNIIDAIKKKEGLYHLTGATDREIATAEIELQLIFHKDYRDYISHFGVVSYGSHELTGICPFPRLNVVSVTQEERKNSPTIPNNCYVIEQANIDGIVVWQSSDGIVFQSSPRKQLIPIAKSLLDYIKLSD